jgi:hypothetical protein
MPSRMAGSKFNKSAPPKVPGATIKIENDRKWSPTISSLLRALAPHVHPKLTAMAVRDMTPNIGAVPQIEDTTPSPAGQTTPGPASARRRGI